MTNIFEVMLRRLLPMLPGILFWGCLLLYIIYRSTHPVKRSKTEKIILRIVGGVFAACIVSGGIILLTAMYGTVVNSKVSNANYCARNVFKAYLTAYTDLSEKDSLPETSEEIIIGTPDGKHEEGSFEALMDDYFADHKYYVIVTDGNWHVLYTLWANDPITMDEIHAYTLDQQKKNMKKLFNRKDLVGYYETSEEERKIDS